MEDDAVVDFDTTPQQDKQQQPLAEHVAQRGQQGLDLASEERSGQGDRRAQQETTQVDPVGRVRTSEQLLRRTERRCLLEDNPGHCQQDHRQQTEGQAVNQVVEDHCRAADQHVTQATAFEPTSRARSSRPAHDSPGG